MESNWMETPLGTESYAGSSPASPTTIHKEFTMPISEYFKGSGLKVMADMKKRYGDVEGERRFYATANVRNAKPGQKMTKSTKTKRKPRGGKKMKTVVRGATRLDTY